MGFIRGKSIETTKDWRHTVREAGFDGSTNMNEDEEESFRLLGL